MGELHWTEALSFGFSIAPFCWALDVVRYQGTLQFGIGPFRFFFNWK